MSGLIFLSSSFKIILKLFNYFTGAGELIHYV